MRDLKKALRQSRKAIPGHLVFGLLVLACLLLAELIWNVHWLVVLLLLWSVPYGLIGDGINIFYVKRRLKALEKQTHQEIKNEKSSRRR